MSFNPLNPIHIAIKENDYQRVVELCNEQFKKSGYDLELAEIRGNANFNLKKYEEALVDLHNALDAGININNNKIKICVINSKLSNLLGHIGVDGLSRENKKYITELIQDEPSLRTNLEVLFTAKFIDQALATPLESSSHSKIEDDDIAFNPVVYRRFNPELRNLNNVDLENHYKKHGVSEQRISSVAVLKLRLKQMYSKLPEGFTVEGYKLLHADVRNYVESHFYGIHKEYKYIEHYLNEGRNEKRGFISITGFERPKLDLNQINLEPHFEEVLKQFMACKRVLNFKRSYFSKPKLSVLISFEGRFDLLLNLLFSLESQVNQEFEVIILDASKKSDLNAQFFSKIKANIVQSTPELEYQGSINAISSSAKGEILVFLDSALQLTNDVVGKVLTVFSQNRQLGVLGAKIVNGRQVVQEFGQTIFVDGSSQKIGEKYGKDSFWMSYPRRVDSITRKFLATPKSLFDTLSKFDINLIPSPFAEQDYCLKVAEAGYQVMANPGLLLQDNSPESDHLAQENANIFFGQKKEFQAKNSEILKKKILKSMYQELAFVDREKFSQFKKRVLFIDDALPLEKLGNGYAKSNDVLRKLIGHNCFVTYISTAPDLSRGEKIDGDFFDSQKPIEFIKNANLNQIALTISLRKDFYDIVIVNKPKNLIFYENKLEPILGAHKLIINVEKFYSLIPYLKKSELSFSAIDYEEYVLSDLYLNEAKKLKKADILWFSSQLEKLVFDSKSNQEGIPSFELAYSELDVENIRIPFEQRAGISFIATVADANSPNIDAIEVILSDLLPAIRKSSLKHEPFYIIGNVSHRPTAQKIKEYCQKDINTHFHDGVERPELVIGGSKVFVAPIRLASGLPNKLTLPAQLGVPIVASELICQQVFTGANHFISCKTIVEFIDSINRLCTNKTEWDKYSALSYEYAKNHLNINNYEDAFEALINTH